jgi:hypothetical protein
LFHPVDIDSTCPVYCRWKFVEECHRAGSGLMSSELTPLLPRKANASLHLG